MKKVSPRLLAAAFRLYALASRFLLVFLLARFLAPVDVGLYGLLAAMVAFVVYALGMDMYTYTTRAVINADSSLWRRHLVSHLSFLGLVAVIILPLALLLFVGDLLPWPVVAWFYAIVVTEHLGFEIDRFLVAMSRQFAASAVVLIRQGLLPTVIIPLLIYVDQARELSNVLLLWVVGNLLAIVYGAALIVRGTQGGRFSVDWNWVARGVRVAAPFLVGTLCLRLIFTADRQFVSWLSGLEVLAAYTLAITVANGMTSVLTVGVHQFSYPGLVRAVGDSDRDAFVRGVRRLLWQTSVCVGLIALGVVLIAPFVPRVLAEAVYADYWWAIPGATLAMVVYNLSMVPHYALYALHSDRVILFSTVGGTVIFFASVGIAWVAGLDAVAAVILGLFAASATILVVKLVGYRRVFRDHNWQASPAAE